MAANTYPLGKTIERDTKAEDARVIKMKESSQSKHIFAPWIGKKPVSGA